MKRLLSRTFLLFSMILLAWNGTLYSQPYYFRHYEVEAGLSNNAVICSVQDKMGFMWFGTRDGVNRFDGYTFKAYRFDSRNNKNSGNNFIHALFVDGKGSLLVATEKEIYKYNAQLDSFSLLVSPKYFAIEEITADRKGNIWFNARNVLHKFSQSSKRLKIYDANKFFRASSVSIDRDGKIWVSTENGLLKKYNEASDSFSTFDLFAKSNKTLPRNINLIQCISGSKILIGTDKAGFKIFDQQKETYEDVSLCCEKLDKLFIRSFLQVSSTEVWIGTEDGIFIYDTRTRASRKIQKNSTDSYALSDNVIYTLCKDREGGIWAGTYFGGINYYPKQFTPFQKFYYKPFENSLSGNIIREVRKDGFGNLWIGTEDGGLDKLDLQTMKIDYYKPDQSSSSISYIGVHDLLVVGDELWVGTYEHGLDILNIKSGKVVRHYGASSRTGFQTNFPFCLLQTKKGEIIVGTISGIYSYDQRKDYFNPVAGFPLREWYMCILEDKNGTLWSGIPGKGVYYLNRKNNTSGNFRFDPSDTNSLCNDKVNSIFEDSRKNLWFATENGLCKWNPSKRNFTRYGTQNGFTSNFMLAMLEDEKGQLWISTTRGLACFDPIREKTQVFTTANGLLSDQFNFSSAYKDEKGRMFFGSAKGLVSFHPSELNQDLFVPRVFLTGLQIDNQDVSIAKKGSPLKKSISYTNKITLNYDQSTFSIDFAAPGYTAPQNLKYAYLLEGLSSNWTSVKGNRKATFTKLKPGWYVFRVKASSSSGIWSKNETRLSIEVLPPWWASSWAYICYMLASVLLVYSLIKSYRERIEEKNRRKIELLEIAKEKEIMQLEITKEKEILESKIEFFTQVAHEIRTPLTLIKIPLATVLENSEKNPVVENCLQIMEKNTDRLIELSNQLLDFRQTEIRGYSILLEKANISDVLQEAFVNFSALAAQSNIDVKLMLPAEPVFANVDLDAFKKIIYNLLSNAVKYADSIVLISLNISEKTSNSFTIRVKNDGFLIPEHVKEKVFEPFYRIKETETKTGTGIGLALARSLTLIHNGELLLEPSQDQMNIFSLTLPI